MIRVAFTLISGNNWTGGYNYLRNLLTVLDRYQKDHLQSVLFIAESCNADDVAPFTDIPTLELVRTPLLNASRRVKSLVQAIVVGQDRRLYKLFESHQIDVVFEAAQFFGWRSGIATIAWIPDFQHKILPHLFSPWAWCKREFGFRAQIFSGRTIMLSSEDARLACERYYPSTREKTRTVHFAVPPSNPQIFYTEAREIANSYDLPQQFFFMPNQFWQHKNHGLVLDALSILRQRGKRIVVAASGKQIDPRAPHYFPDFYKRLQQANLQDMFRLLGMIPYQHIMSLMHASIALLNPSLFEGWSTTVEEAKSMGIPMLLSDLTVHREQAGDEASYFNRYSAQSLADTLDEFVPLNQSQRALQMETARKIAFYRVEQFAHNFAALSNTVKASF